MSWYWDGDDAWANPLPLQHEGGDGGGLEHGSGAFDMMSQSWPHLTASDTLDNDPHSYSGSTGSRREPDALDAFLPIIGHASQRRLRSHGANVSFTTSTRDTALSTVKCKLTLTAAAPAPKPKQRKAEDPLLAGPSNWFLATRRQRNPTKNTCPHCDPINLTMPNPDPTKIEQGSRIGARLGTYAALDSHGGGGG
ncbi:hypothetical protein B0H13DRAFT_1908206 [Mycena leptocephala]|nr:hypothetical protein B0H13DRAFT_1908206 [Mycena leptocephala]